MANLKDLIVNGSARILGTIYGNLSGNATSATKATQDGNGNVIASTYATQSSLGDKQDTLVSGTNIKTINSESILGSGDIEIKSAPDLDDKTISKNSSEELQAIGVIDSSDNTTALKTWTGTKAEYDAIETKDSSTLYNITDDSDVTLTLLETIYPVGSLYLTTASTCPLAALFGTWQLVANDKVLQGAGSRGSVGSTLDESLPNIKGTIGAVVGNGGSSYFFGYRNGTGAFSGLESQSLGHDAYTTTANTNDVNVPTFDASRSSSTYQDGAPVQQDAYLINVYERIA